MVATIKVSVNLYYYPKSRGHIVTLENSQPLFLLLAQCENGDRIGVWLCKTTYYGT